MTYSLSFSFFLSPSLPISFPVFSFPPSFPFSVSMCKIGHHRTIAFSNTHSKCFRFVFSIFASVFSFVFCPCGLRVSFLVWWCGMCGLSNPWLLLCDVRSRHSHVLHADCASALINRGSPEERSPVHSSATPFSFLRLLILSQAKQTNIKEYQ